MGMTEATVTKHAIRAVADFIEEQLGPSDGIVARTETLLRDRSGRADALVVGSIDDELIVVAIESKSAKTIRQLQARYDRSGHLGEAIATGLLLGGLAAGANRPPGPAGLVGFGLSLGLRGRAYTLVEAVSQLRGYPAHFQVLSTSADALKGRGGLVDELSEACDDQGVGLVVVSSSRTQTWEVYPTRRSTRRCPLDKYCAGEDILDVLDDL